MLEHTHSTRKCIDQFHLLHRSAGICEQFGIAYPHGQTLYSRDYNIQVVLVVEKLEIARLVFNARRYQGNQHDWCYLTLELTKGADLGIIPEYGGKS